MFDRKRRGKDNERIRQESTSYNGERCISTGRGVEAVPRLNWDSMKVGFALARVDGVAAACDLVLS